MDRDGRIDYGETFALPAHLGANSARQQQPAEQKREEMAAHLFPGYYTSKRAGLWDDERDRPTFRFHDLRRSAARNLKKTGATEEEIMRIGGWKTPSEFRRYAIVTERDLVQVTDRVGIVPSGS